LTVGVTFLANTLHESETFIALRTGIGSGTGLATGETDVTLSGLLVGELSLGTGLDTGGGIGALEETGGTVGTDLEVLDSGESGRLVTALGLVDFTLVTTGCAWSAFTGSKVEHEASLAGGAFLEAFAGNATRFGVAWLA
jgi:hypothetical protein